MLPYLVAPFEEMDFMLLLGKDCIEEAIAGHLFLLPDTFMTFNDKCAF